MKKRTLIALAATAVLLVFVVAPQAGPPAVQWKLCGKQVIMSEELEIKFQLPSQGWCLTAKNPQARRSDKPILRLQHNDWLVMVRVFEMTAAPEAKMSPYKLAIKIWHDLKYQNVNLLGVTTRELGRVAGFRILPTRGISNDTGTIWVIRPSGDAAARYAVYASWPVRSRADRQIAAEVLKIVQSLDRYREGQ